jgi:hypothetical protein
VLFLRGLRARFRSAGRFQAALDRYEMRDAIADRFVSRDPLASGCFMAMRTDLFRAHRRSSTPATSCTSRTTT